MDEKRMVLPEGEKPSYEPPVVIQLGNLACGAGQAPACRTGTSALGDCRTGNVAEGACGNGFGGGGLV